MDDSIRPGYRRISSIVAPGGGHIRGQFGANDGEVARLRSLVHSLMNRVKTLEEKLSSVTGTDLNVGRYTARGDVVDAPTPEVADHYHTFLVYPGTSTPALEIDADGATIFQNIWRTFVTANNKQEQYDANLGVGSRSWTPFNNYPPSLG